MNSTVHDYRHRLILRAIPATSPDVIYRYQPFRPDVIDLIRNGRLWFSDPSRFNDPFDFMPNFKMWKTQLGRDIDQSRESARWTDAFNSYIRKEFLNATETQRSRLLREKLLTEQSRFRTDLAQNFRVTCFSADNDNILMWSHYAAYHSGLCVGIRPAKMRLTPEQALRWKVTYRNQRLPINHKKPNEIALRKAKAWKYENEWRVVMAMADLKSGRRPLERRHKQDPPSEAGYFWQLQWDAIESVRFGILVNRTKRSMILKLLQTEKRNHIRAIQMHPSIERFSFEEEVL